MTYTLFIQTTDEIFSEFYEERMKSNMENSGFDIFFQTDGVFEENQVSIFGFGVRCFMVNNETGKRHGFYLYPRSSICKADLMLANSVGIIDASYNGEIKGAFRNFYGRNHPNLIRKGTSLVQICAPNLEIFDVKRYTEEKLPETQRGDGGFGSTGNTK